jgi:putative hydrolases of HD superfamily
VNESIDEVVAFVLELDKLKGVERKTRPLGLTRYESSAEHSWQIAMLAASLASFAGLVDMSRVIAMLLVHDIGEIDTGDTIVFAEGGWEERKLAERRAVERIFAILPARASEFLALWTEFEANTTAESRFANAVDRAMPVLLNLSNGGQSWRENGISYERVVAKVRPPVEAGCPALWVYLERRLDDARGAGLFGAP